MTLYTYHHQMVFYWSNLINPPILLVNVNYFLTLLPPLPSKMVCVLDVGINIVLSDMFKVHDLLILWVLGTLYSTTMVEWHQPTTLLWSKPPWLVSISLLTLKMGTISRSITCKYATDESGSINTTSNSRCSNPHNHKRE